MLVTALSLPPSPSRSFFFPLFMCVLRAACVHAWVLRSHRGMLSVLLCHFLPYPLGIDITEH